MPVIMHPNTVADIIKKVHKMLDEGNCNDCPHFKATAADKLDLIADCKLAGRPITTIVRNALPEEVNSISPVKVPKWCPIYLMTPAYV